MKKLNGSILQSLLIVVLLGLLAACGDSATATIPPAAITASVSSAPPSPTQRPNTPTTATTQAATPTSTPFPITTPPTLAAVTTPSTAPTTQIAQTTQASSPTQAVTATLAPAGKPYPGKIVYDTTDEEIIVINPDGSGRTKIANGTSPLFSPDGQRIAFIVRERPANNTDFGKAYLSSVRLDGSDQQNYCEMGANAAITLVRWSPRNRFIALNATQNGPGGIWLCNLVDKTMTSASLKTSQGGVSVVYDWTSDGGSALWQASPDYFNQTL